MREDWASGRVSLGGENNNRLAAVVPARVGASLGAERARQGPLGAAPGGCAMPLRSSAQRPVAPWGWLPSTESSRKGASQRRQILPSADSHPLPAVSVVIGPVFCIPSASAVWCDGRSWPQGREVCRRCRSASWSLASPEPCPFGWTLNRLEPQAAP